MAALATEENADTGVLEDPISLEPYTAPTRILPCGHTLNHDTLVGLLVRANVDDDDNQYCECPLDRQRFNVKPADEFPRNFVLEQQIVANEEQQAQRNADMERRLAEQNAEIERRLKAKMEKELDDNLKAMEMSSQEQEELQKTRAEKLGAYKSAKKTYLAAREALLMAERDLLKAENEAKEVGLKVVSVITEQAEDNESKSGEDEDDDRKKPAAPDWGEPDWAAIERLVGQEVADEMKQGSAFRGTLDLRFKNLNPAACKELAPALLQMTGLQVLVLSDNQIGDAGCEILAKILPQMTGLQVLWLDGNQIGDAGCEILAKILPQMTGLQWLWLGANRIGELGKTRMREAWKAAGKGEGLYL